MIEDEQSAGLDGQDMARMLEALDVELDVYRLQWSRTEPLDSPGHITITVDIPDLRQLTSADRHLLAGLGHLLRERDARKAALHIR